jgi:hypothetical protein
MIVPLCYEKLDIANLLLYCVMNLTTICFTYELSHVLYLQAFACYVVEVRVMLHECHHVRVINSGIRNQFLGCVWRRYNSRA